MSPQSQAGLSLFPNSSSSRCLPLHRPPTARRTQSSPDSPEPASPPRDHAGSDDRPGAHQQQQTFAPIEFEPPRLDDNRVTLWPQPSKAQTDDSPSTLPPISQPSTPLTQPKRPARIPLRIDTGSSQTRAPVRETEPQQWPLAEEIRLPPLAPPLRSIFPTYNPHLPLEQQEYAPTHTSPSSIPRAVISRQSYFQGPPSPEATGARSRSQWPLRPHAQEPPTVPKPCTTSQLRGLWKATNGWKASSSEGRVYCLALSRLRDAPVYTLSSASAQPFYKLRLDPTSVSANVSLTRHDPGKPYKAPKADLASSTSSASSGSKASDAKAWREALSTTLEEEARRHAPQDGLIALLMPSPAAKMALRRASDPMAAVTAENECARLVWDDDSATHFLVHPALATPFCVTVDRSPAYSRTVYTLEHHESPRHLVKLTRDGTGGGWIELDTSIASKIESYYILDVAVTALLLVASADDRNSVTPPETFDPPPPPPAVLANGGRRSSGKFSILSSRREEWRKKKSKRGSMEEFEIDVESQDGSMDKDSRRKKSSAKKPFLLRAVVKVAKGLCKCVLWAVMVVLKCMAAVFKLLYKCVGSKY
ncbi:hypothetical protein HIM_06822 [Hirsutella minnesotensis 3608]|uniref:Acetylserotonin methytransferase-like protein n=1 Tax=Hirsutella minnesotensis 3608 TaxID=1043627 RepID=A0A0F8A4J8_9HYPO|nr:hypothetical protein HIM_06822 [Hirsutella minnesotensis 3608]